MARYIGDDFNIADVSALPNPPWISRVGASVKGGSPGVGVTSNAALSQQAFSVSQHAVALSGDNFQIDILCGAVTGLPRSLYMMGGVNATGECALVSLDAQAGNTCVIYSTSDWDTTTAISQASVLASSFGTYAAGDWMSFVRYGKTYTVLKNFLPTGLTWTDSTNVVPIDVNHRFVCIGNYTNNAGEWQGIDKFRARTLDAKYNNMISRSVPQKALCY